MANIKISELPAATTPVTGTEIIEVIQSGENRKLALSDLPGGTGVPNGGATGEILAKQSAADGDADWQPSPHPPGGLAGQVLRKNSATDGDAGWYDATGTRTKSWISLSSDLVLGTGDVKVTFDTVEFDTASAWDAVNDRFQPTVAGFYLFIGRVEYTSGITDVTIRIKRNGVDVMSSLGAHTTASLSAHGGITVLEANGTTDYFELFSNSSGAKTAKSSDEGTYFQLIGPL